MVIMPARADSGIAAARDVPPARAGRPHASRTA